MFNRKHKKSLWKFVLIALGAVLVLFAASAIYVMVNKQKLVNDLSINLSRKMGAKILIGDVGINVFKSFPWSSVRLDDVLIADSLYEQHKRPLLKAKAVFLSANPLRLFSSEKPIRAIIVEDATMQLFTDSSGYSNTYLLKNKQEDSARSKGQVREYPLKKIHLSQFHFVLDDKLLGKRHEVVANDLLLKLHFNGSKVSLNVDADLQIIALGFNTQVGEYLPNKSFDGKFDLNYQMDTKRLIFENVRADVDRQLIRFDGFIDLGKVNPQMEINIQSEKINYIKVQEFVPQKLSKSLKMVQIDKPLQVVAKIAGSTRDPQPLIVVNGKAAKTSLLTPFMDFSNANFNYHYTNQVDSSFKRSDSNSVITITNFNADWHTIPVTSKEIKILNLTHPLLTCDLVSNFNLQKLNNVIGSTFDFKSGDGSVFLSYKGPVEKNDQTNSFINGSITFQKGNMIYLPRKIGVQDVDGVFKLQNSNLYIPNLSAAVFGQKFQMNGYADNLLSLAAATPNAATINWNIQSNQLDLNPFIALVRKRGKVTIKKSQNKSIDDFAQKFDALMEQGQFSLNFKSNALRFKKFNAQNVLANITLLSNNYLINNVSMQSENGNIRVNGAFQNAPRENYANINANFSNVDVQGVLVAFNNFGQDAITGNNLRGILNADVKGNFVMTDDGSILPNKTKAIVDFYLKDGALVKFEPLKKFQKFIFKNRNFDHIAFAPLKNRFEVNGSEIKMNRMEISSSVLRFFVEGNYSLAGNTDLSIQIPFKNLKKQDADYVPENMGVNTSVGRSLFLRGIPVDKKGGVTFALDLFKKYHKEQKNKAGKEK